jgi:UDP-N-acetylglucosamine--N-acetylmuramyl-(pentapeptide) pyrophosphoryl-undecaprenol N-acetylglucosamine transferase
MSLTVLFAGGGSGGHVFPLIAVAEAVRRRHPDAKAVFVGTARGMEATILPARGERLELLEAHPIKGVGVLGALKGASKAATSIPAARALVKRIAPDVVLTIGGYAAGAVSLAAYTLGVPVALLEPNSVLGLANRLMTPMVKRAYVVFPEAEKRFRPSVARRFGLPIRPGFSPAPYVASDSAKVLVLGGSQGAQALNEAVPAAIAMAKKAIPALTVVHQAGKGKDAEVRARYEALGVGGAADVRAFLDDVPQQLAGCDLVVARAGAGAICEIAAVGRAALYVPFPHAADDHQRKNAEALADAGAAVCVAQTEASPERLAREIESLFTSPSRRVAIAETARARGVPDAADRIAEDLESLVRAPSAARASTLAEGF